MLRGLLGEDFRGMSRRLAECPLFRWICGLEELAAVRVPGKSTLQDYAHWMPPETMRPMIERLILTLLPRAQKQAHERIISERKVKNSEKLLSLYETDTRVTVHGKAGAEVKFGNTLLLAEQKDGLIVDR